MPGWTNGGNWENLAAQGGVANIMADLCNAVNERYTVVGGSAIEWWTNGLATTTPVPSDFDDLAFRGEETNVNMSLMRVAIDDLADRYYYGGTPPPVHPLYTIDSKTSDNTDAYNDWQHLSYPSFADFLDTLGYGSAWVQPIRSQSYPMWEQIRLALVAMTWYEQQPTYGVTDLASAGIRGEGFEPTREEAWGILFSGTTEPYGGGSMQASGYGLGGGGTSWFAYKFINLSKTTWAITAWDFGPGFVPDRQFMVHRLDTNSTNLNPVTFSLTPGTSRTVPVIGGATPETFTPGFEGANTWVVGDNVASCIVTDPVATPATITRAGWSFRSTTGAKFLVDLSLAFTYY